MLISTVLPILSVYRLPHGQYGYSGHIINLPQDMTTFVTSLPRHSNELDVLLVRKEGSSASHRDFRVRRSVVLRALQWLKTNNIYYKDVKIDMDKLRQLPEDGDLTGLSTVMMEMSINEDTTTEQEDPHAANLTTPMQLKVSTFPQNLARPTNATRAFSSYCYRGLQGNHPLS